MRELQLIQIHHLITAPDIAELKQKQHLHLVAHPQLELLEENLKDLHQLSFLIGHGI